jgi:hypothetical protein
MAKDLVGDIEGANNALSKMERLLERLTTTAGKFGTAISKPFQGMGNGGTGQRGLGVGSGNRLDQALGNFSTPPGGSVGATWEWTKRRDRQMSLLQGGIKGATGLIAGGFMAMPDVETTITRASGFYGANLLQGVPTKGVIGRKGIADATFGAMKGGITGLGMDAATAGILSGYGVSTNATGLNSGQFSNLARSTANAAKYLGMDNAAAADALGGLTSGATSQSLMRNFGMYTTDPITGRRLTPTEIFKQLNARMTGGQKLSVEDLKTSMQGGALASNLQNSGLDAAQQRLAYQYMLDSAAGKNMDLGDNELMARLTKDAGGNPMEAEYTSISSQTKTMETATDAYIEGMKQAAIVLEQFNGAMQTFLKSPAGDAMARLNAGVNLGMRDPVAAGAVTAGTGLLSAVGGIAGTALAARALTKSLTKANVIGAGAKHAVMIGGKAYTPGMKLPPGLQWGGKKGRDIVDAKTQTKIKPEVLKDMKVSGASALSKGLGKAVPIVGTALTGFSIIDNFSKGNWRGLAGDIGGIVGGVGAAAGLTAFTGGAGIVGSVAAYGIGSYGGSMLGQGIYDMFTGGGDGGGNSLGAGTNSAVAPGGADFKLIHPVGKARMVCGYGVVDDLHPDGHLAVDWSAAEGTGIMAAASGKVTYTGGSAANTMGTSNRAYGLNVIIDHGNGYSTLYAHVSGFDVSPGQQVIQGQQIARVGNTGYSVAPHLHFELRQGSKKIDPSPFLGANYAANKGVLGGGTASNSVRGMGGSADAGLLGFSSGAMGSSGAKVPSSYKGAAIGKSVAAGGGRTSASSGGSGTLLGKGTSTGANLGGGMGTTGGGDGPGRGGGNNFVINVNVASASESEARRFAKLIQEYLDNDTLTSSMGRL